MINTVSLTKEWINNLRKTKLKKADPSLIEKMSYAFYLLEQLASQNLDFTFKGGTSLILITNKINRFSTDIDIITESSKEQLERAFEKIIRLSVFTSYELDINRSYENSKIPKAHYFFYYNSGLNKKPNSVLLDILFEGSNYPNELKYEINLDFLDIDQPVNTVNCPSVDSILGDKLTAFAPNTTGIPYNSYKSLEIVKQLFDINNLIESSRNYKIVHQSFCKIAQKEISYRGLDIEIEDILIDIIETCLIIVLRDKNKGINLHKFNEIQDGIKRFIHFPIISKFRIENAIIASAKTSYFAAKLLVRDFSQINNYSNSLNINDLEVVNVNYSFLNKLKRIHKEAFFYFFNLIRIIDENKVELK